MRDAHNELLDTMMQSYRNLIRFARRNNLRSVPARRIRGVLTRKLYAAFRGAAGKVTWSIRRFRRTCFQEENLTFIYVLPGNAPTAAAGICIIRHRHHTIIGQSKPLEYNRYLNKLVS